MAQHDNIEAVYGPSFSKKFQFYTYEDGKQIFIKKNRPVFVWIYKDKSISYICQNKKVFPYNDTNSYTAYLNSIGDSVSREIYIPPSTITVTEKDREKGLINRYFVKYLLDGSIFEINKEKFDLELTFYKKVKIVWYLDNSTVTMKMKNMEQIRKAKKEIDDIDKKLDPLEFHKEKVEMTKQEKVHEKLNRLKQY